jgi:serine/threonine protein kinase
MKFQEPLNNSMKINDSEPLICTNDYIAPEIREIIEYDLNQISPKADAFSLGLVVLIAMGMPQANLVLI